MTIKSKLILIIFVTTTVALLLSSALIIWSDIVIFQTDIKNHVQIMAKVIASNLIPALQFDDRDRMEEILRTLQNIEYIKKACIYDNAGFKLACYSSDRYHSEAAPDILSLSEGNKGDSLDIIQPIMFLEAIPGSSDLKEHKIGSLYISASLFTLQQRIKDYLLRIIGVISLVLLISLIFAVKLQELVSKPISFLSGVTRRVTQSGDYSIRVESLSTDEIGILYHGFNKMLEQIHNRDVQRNNVQHELTQAQSFLKNVIDSMSSTLLTIDDQYLITQINAAGLHLLGQSPEQVFNHALTDFLPEFDRYLIHYKSIIKQQNSRYFPREGFAKYPDRIFTISMFPLESEINTGMVIRMDDITEQDKKEQHLRQAQKMDTIGTLVGGIAHDFNNALGGIIGTISLMQYKIHHRSDFDRAQFVSDLKILDESSNRASLMVKQLLSISRKQEPSFKAVDVNQIIRNVIQICTNTMEKSVEIVPEYYDREAVVNGDSSQLEQVILNLCLNGYHAMTLMRNPQDVQGGMLNISVDLIMADSHFCINHVEAIEGRYWKISVRDEGIGIDAKNLSKIFDPFFTTKDKDQGTGLGLAMVYNIISQHHGFVDVYSELGNGSCFNVYLPVMTDHHLESQPQVEARLIRGHGTILVVDDEDIIRDITRSILEECGYQVLAAENGLAGLDIYRTHYQKIDLVLLDIVMPKLSGKDTFLEMIRINPTAKVLVASGFKQDDRVRDILNQGAVGFIQKPYTMLRLSEAVFQVMNS